MKTILSNLLKVIEEKPLKYQVKQFAIYAADWEVYKDGELVELSPIDMARLDLQHRVLQANLDYHEDRVIETIGDALDYADYLVNTLGLNARLRERVLMIKKNQEIYEAISYKEIEELMKVANLDYLTDSYSEDLIKNAHRPIREVKRDAKD